MTKAPTPATGTQAETITVTYRASIAIYSPSGMGAGLTSKFLGLITLQYRTKMTNPAMVKGIKSMQVHEKELANLPATARGAYYVGKVATREGTVYAFNAPIEAGITLQNTNPESSDLREALGSNGQCVRKSIEEYLAKAASRFSGSLWTYDGLWMAYGDCLTPLPITFHPSNWNNYSRGYTPRDAY